VDADVGRLQKVVLAAFTATFAFSFALLREVETGPVPDLGVTVVGLAVSADLVLLLLYLDRFVHALRPVAVAAAVARSGLAVMAKTDRVDGAPLARAPRGRERRCDDSSRSWTRRSGSTSKRATSRRSRAGRTGRGSAGTPRRRPGEARPR
jgi:hypothetical protein